MAILSCSWEKHLEGAFSVVSRREARRYLQKLVDIVSEGYNLPEKYVRAAIKDSLWDYAKKHGEVARMIAREFYGCSPIRSEYTVVMRRVPWHYNYLY